MARPRKNEHIKEALLNVGLDTLLTKGYHGTGIKEVLDRLGVPKGSFYHYFKSKEAFAAEVIHHYARELNDRLAALMAGSEKTGIAAIKHAFMLLVEEYRSGQCGCILGALASEISETSEVCRLAILKEVENWNSMLAVLVTQGQQNGDIRTDLSAEVLAKMLWNCWEGGVVRMKIEASPTAVEDVVNIMFDAMLKR
jgi:TetR/AcrR family transcriptional repressor of nem operon